MKFDRKIRQILGKVVEVGYSIRVMMIFPVLSTGSVKNFTWKQFTFLMFLAPLIFSCAPKVVEKGVGRSTGPEWVKGEPKGNRDKARNQAQSSAQLGGLELRNKIEEALAQEDPRKRAGKLKEILPHIPAETRLHAELCSILVQIYAVLVDLKEMEAHASMIEIGENLESAQILNAMAYAYAETGTKLSLARKYVMRALTILDRHERRGPPLPRVGGQEWLGALETNRGYYLDTLAWIDLKKGRVKVAVATLQQAVKRADLGAIRYHLGVALAESGDRSAAAKNYARAIVLGGEDTEKAREQLKSLGDDIDQDAYLKAAKDWAQLEAKKRVMRMAIDVGVPKFHLEDLNGDVTNNERLADGSVTVIEFWASWCGPCRDEFPVLQRIYDSYRADPKVRFLAISVDERLEDAKDFVAEGAYTFPVAHEPEGEVALAFQVQGLPTLLVVGPDGRIRFRHVGFSPYMETLLEMQIKVLLEGDTEVDNP